MRRRAVRPLESFESGDEEEALAGLGLLGLARAAAAARALVGLGDRGDSSTRCLLVTGEPKRLPSPLEVLLLLGLAAGEAAEAAGDTGVDDDDDDEASSAAAAAVRLAPTCGTGDASWPLPVGSLFFALPK